MSTSNPHSENASRSSPPSGVLNNSQGAPLPNSDTETLFDELDALLQRMLALPVDSPEDVDQDGNPLGDEVPLITVAEAAPEPLSPESNTTPACPVCPDEDEVFRSLAERQSAEILKDWDREAPSNPAPLAPSTPQVVDPGIPPPGQGPVATPPQETLISQAPESHATDEPPPPPWLVPVVWLNLCYDRSLIPLGRAGRWLRLGFGRHLLGWVGALLLLAAFALVVGDWMGWTW